ncbi:magnesium-dependent phosphatase-1 [Tremella mesenterica]|uniref:Magnesium-dependent phosphatase-1 n=1 Tax=Tremella mesenterica TaxID=5217 RepID=A0A4Q1BW27_TREME|nr:magnesium-dependent phosphatase-1 [Tremella mesenterica]
MPRRSRDENAPRTEGELRSAAPNDPEAWPLLVAFDLDYTLWDLWIDTHISPPLRRKGDVLNQLIDRRGQTLEFYPEVPSLLAELKERRIHVAAASRTSAVDLAKEALGMLLLPGPSGEHVRAITYFNSMEIYPSENSNQCLIVLHT